MGGAFGAAVGGAIVGARLDSGLLERLGAERFEEVGGAEELIRSPENVRDLPDELRQPVAEVVADAVVAVVWRSIPVMILIGLLALLVRETPLRTSSAIGGEDTTTTAD
jgi:hypothetical protein